MLLQPEKISAVGNRIARVEDLPTLFNETRRRFYQRLHQAGAVPQGPENIYRIQLEQERRQDCKNDRDDAHVHLEPLLGAVLRAAKPALKSVICQGGSALHRRAKIASESPPPVSASAGRSPKVWYEAELRLRFDGRLIMLPQRRDQLRACRTSSRRNVVKRGLDLAHVIEFVQDPIDSPGRIRAAELRSSTHGTTKTPTASSVWLHRGMFDAGLCGHERRFGIVTAVLWTASPELRQLLLR